MADPQFHVDLLLEIPRVTNLALAPDGSRLVATVASVGPDAKRFVSALWELDPHGAHEPRRLTRSGEGESNAAFLPGGSLAFTSKRADPDRAVEPDDKEPPALWLLPRGAGEARTIASTPGGIEALAVARDAGTMAWAAPSFPGTANADEDSAQAKAREDAGVTAQLFQASRRRCPLPLLPRREPLDREAAEHPPLVPDGAGLPGPPRPGAGMGPGRR